MVDILTTPNQMMIEWVPRHIAERYVRKGAKIVERKVKGLDKDLNPNYHYLIIYDNPRFTGIKLRNSLRR